MKKKLFSLFLALVASVGTIFAKKVQIGDLYYNLDQTNKTAEVTYKSYNDNNYNYNEDWNVTTANIPSSVTYNSVTYSVTSIGDHAFDDSGLTSVTIPNSVSSIGERAFFRCNRLTSVTIPNSVTNIGDGAFWNCAYLSSVTIPNSVTSIGECAFYNCRSLTSVTIPNSVTSIGRSAFLGCSGLTSVTIPNSVTSIGERAFDGCSGLTSVTIPNSVTSIGANAFRACSSLTSITIPNSVTSIGDWAFLLCSGLTSINVETNNPNYCSVEGVLFNKDKTRLMQYPGGKQGAYTIPNSVTSIGDRAFLYCTGLTSVTIPNSVTSIEQYAFSDCSGLTSVTIEAETPPVLSNDVFEDTNNCPIYVPCNAVNTYKTAFVWRLYANRIYGNCTSDCADVNATWLQTGGSGLGEITTNDSTVWIYDAQYGAKASKQGGYTGYLMTPAKDLRGMKSVTLSFMHTHKFASTPSNELTLWVTPDYKGSVEASQWQQLTIAPYAANTNWTFVSVSINVPVSKVGTNTVFAFKYMSTASNYSTWQIKNLTLIAQCEGSTPPQPTYYTIKFKNWDGSVLQSTQVEEGQMPQYTGATPTKPDDSQYTYTFSGWTPQIVAATADATYTATFAATKLPTEECGVNATWLQTGGSGLGEMTTDNSGIWTYENRYGACAKANSGETGWLLSPAKDLRGMKSVNLSFLHVHKNAGTFTDDMTLWVCANYKGSVSASQWQQLTITPYSTNNNWVYVNVSIDVPLNMVGANTVFGFKYTSSNGSAQWEIKELNLNAECATGEQGIDNIDSSNLQGGDRGRLILRNGQVFILRGDKTYTLQGQETIIP